MKGIFGFMGQLKYLVGIKKFQDLEAPQTA
jgi:hypothetical protein